MLFSLSLSLSGALDICFWTIPLRDMICDVGLGCKLLAGIQLTFSHKSARVQDGPATGRDWPIPFCPRFCCDEGPRKKKNPGRLFARLYTRLPFNSPSPLDPRALNKSRKWRQSGRTDPVKENGPSYFVCPLCCCQWKSRFWPLANTETQKEKRRFLSLAQQLPVFIFIHFFLNVFVFISIDRAKGRRLEPTLYYWLETQWHHRCKKTITPREIGVQINWHMPVLPTAAMFAEANRFIRANWCLWVLPPCLVTPS